LSIKNLDKTDNNNQCFSFGKRIRTIIYVKMNKDYKSSVKKPKECPEGKVLNPLTGRCIKIKKVNK
jgi:hypothetical protein